MIGFHQGWVAYDQGYFFTRLHETLEPMKTWMWFRILPDTMMILGWVAIFWDLTSKILFSKKEEKVLVKTVAKAKKVVKTVKKAVTKKTTTKAKTTAKKTITKPVKKTPVKKVPAKKSVVKKTTTTRKPRAKKTEK